MKVLRVIASMNPATGGPCQGIRNSVPCMEMMGCKTEVVCLDDPRSLFSCSDPFPVHALGRGWGALNYHPRLVNWLVLNLERFDAVIIHGLWLWPGIATWLAIRKLRRRSKSSPKVPPYFVMPHGMLDPWFQVAEQRKWKALRNRLYWGFVERRVIRDATAILFTCQKELELAKTTFPRYEPHREINIGYGIPDPPKHNKGMDRAFRQKCPSLPYNQPYLLFLSRIHPKKGIDLLIRAYAEVYHNLPSVKSNKITDQTSDHAERNASSVSSEPPHLSPQFLIPKIPDLVIAGPLDSDYANEMIRLAESLFPGRVFIPGKSPGLVESFVMEGDQSQSAPNSQPTSSMDGVFKPVIHFTGMLQSDSKWGALYGCEFFVLPSHQENFGISVAEALSCSKPVLISSQVNIVSVVEEAAAGFAATNNFDGTLLLLTESKSLSRKSRQQMSENAFRLFQDQFHIVNASRSLLRELTRSE